MRILLLTLLLSLASTARSINNLQGLSMMQNPYGSYAMNAPQLNTRSPKNLNSQNYPLQYGTRQLNQLPIGNLPDNIQLQKMWENYQTIQMANQREDAEAADLNEELPISSKTTRGLRSSKGKNSKTRRHLEGEDDKKEGEKKPEETENKAGEENAAEKAEEKVEEPAEEESTTESSAAEETNTEDQEENTSQRGNGGGATIDSLLDKLLLRGDSINDKVDHLLFHNHHDLAGMTAHYTPYGIQMLPSTKGPNSVDQKLKMIDYMHNLGGGYNPMLHSMLPFYLGHNENAGGIKLNGIMGVDVGTSATRRRKLL